MVACTLSLREGMAVRIGSRETPFTKPLPVTKKRVTDLLPPIGIDAGSVLRPMHSLYLPGVRSFDHTRTEPTPQSARS
jgi:hypothetical protein